MKTILLRFKLSAPVREGIVKETITILRDPTFAPLFGPDSRAEVALSAEIARPAGRKGPALRLSGKIDRLVKTDQAVLIVDFKSDARPPTVEAGVPEAYFAQLGLYALVARQLFPGAEVAAAILWTDLESFMNLSPERLRKAVSSFTIG